MAGVNVMGTVATSFRWIIGMAILTLASLSVPRVARAERDTCALVEASDVAALVGASPAQNPSAQGGSCSWSGARAGHKLLIITYSSKGIPPEIAYAGARRQSEAGGDAKITDESGIGDKAFSGQVSFGAVFIALKNGRLLQLQYHTGASGTSADVTALRSIMKKATAAY
jgi:hypothetical protein